MTKSEGSYSNAFTATWKGITDLFRKQKNQVLLKEEDRIEGKQVMITGASSGLGLAAALDLARRGAHLWMACRSGIPAKGEWVRKLSGNDHVEMLPVDLSDMDSIVGLVNKLKDSRVRLDVLICNAGIVPASSRKTRQGLEEMFMVNYLAKFLLVRLLLENNLFNTGNQDVPRIIFVSSESHRNPKDFDWEGFGKFKDYAMNKSVELYGYYKLLMTTFANELSRKRNTGGQTRYSVFALCPGPVNSNIAREAPGFVKPLLKIIFRFFFRSPEAAVKPVIYFACSPEVQGKPLDYLFLMSRKDMDSKATDEKNGIMLWELSENLLKDYGFEFSNL